MRTLKFIVDDQIIKKDPNCNFDNLVPGTEGYMRAEFSFSPEWNGYIKVVGFYSMLGKEYPPQVLVDGKSCDIPVEALERRGYRIKVFGKKGKQTLTTNKVGVEQNGGR